MQLKDRKKVKKTTKKKERKLTDSELEERLIKLVNSGGTQ